MSTALEAASLIMIPTSYSDGLLASAKPNDGAGDFTFSRGSNTSATRVNADGNIEKGYENLLLQSNSFTTTPWVQVSILPPTSGQTGYDGSTDAWYFEKTGAFGRLQQSISTSGVQTYSVYLKAKDSSWVNIEIHGASTSRQYFDLTAPIETAKGSSNNIVSSSIEDAGNGWRKCSITYEGSKTFLFIFIAEGNGQVSGTTGSLYIQDAMLNQELVAYPYVETTTAPVAAGILEDTPRIDFSGGDQSLLLEPSRTSLIKYSEYFGVGWIQDNLSIITNDATSPEGLQNATKVYPTSSGNYRNIRLSPSQPSSEQITISIFAKAAELDHLVLIDYDGSGVGIDFNLSTGVATDSATTDFDFVDMVDYGNGWYRCIATATNPYFYWILSDNGGLSVTANGTDGLYIYGAQAEQGSYPTSYIPTYGVSQTRLVETIDRLILPESLGTEFTIFFDTELFQSGNGLLIFEDVNNAEVYKFYSYSNHYDILNLQNGQYLVKTDAAPNGKIALSQSGSTIKIYVNGQEKTKAGAVGNTTEITKFRINQTSVGSNICLLNQMIIFPTALSDDECITLTTI